MNVACVNCGVPCSPGPRCDRCALPQGGSDDFYRSSRWRRVSVSYRQKHPVCERCDRHPSKDVHHVVPREKCADPYDERNLVALCASCHVTVTPRVRWVVDEYGRTSDPA